MTETAVRDTGRYTGVAIALHWLIAALLVSLILYGWALEDQRETITSYDEFLEVKSGFNWHKTGGILVLALSLFRLFWRFTHPVPPLPDGMKAWERIGARITHIGFYVMMIGLPIGGYMVASAYGSEQPILLFDAIELPKLPVPQTPEFQSFAGSMHSAGAWALIVLAGVHIAAAMKHEFVKNDGVLARMIPMNR
jgi:cytochrome b561